MPMRWGRVRKYLKLGKGVLKYGKLGILYFKLLFKPSDLKTQEMVLGLDPGASYDGFSVVSKTQHHENINTEHTRNIKKRMTKRSLYRRIRRSRLWHRKTRFDNRTSSKLVPTIKSKVEFRKWIITKLNELYPIKTVVIEDVKFDHSKDPEGKFYSLTEIGKTSLYSWVKDKFNLETFDHKLTRDLRIEIFGKDLKSKEVQKSFYSHCIDSFSIVKKYSKCFKVNTKIRYITKIWMSRRELFREKNKIKDACKYFKYKKGGEKIFFEKLSKPRKIRVKITESKSNHGAWQYQLTEPVICFKKFKTNYGGTIKQGNSRSKVPSGKSKYSLFKNGKLVAYRKQKVESISSPIPEMTCSQFLSPMNWGDILVRKDYERKASEHGYALIYEYLYV